MNNPYAVTSSDIRVAALADVSERSDFIKRTYLHLGGAIIGFVLLEALLLNTVGPAILDMFGANRWMPLVFIGAFVGVGWLARWWAESEASPSLQYAGLGLYVVAEAIIMAPLLYIATKFDDHIPMSAGIITAVVFAGLTAFTFISGTDFSWMRGLLWVGGLGAMAAVLCGAIMGFSLGIWFAVAMVVLAAGYILYDTSNVLHHYRTTQHVAASLALFSSVAVLFYYVVRILMALREE